MASPLPKGDVLLHGGRHGTGETGVVIACRHRGVETRLQVSQPTQRTDDPPAELLNHRGDVGITGRLALKKVRLEALVGAIEIHPLKEGSLLPALAN
jgi:hypothetical protein